jgi:hypothetical protein
VSLRAHILSFLRDPLAFAAAVSDPELWLAGLEAVAEPAIQAAGDHPLRPAQVEAWRGLAQARAGLVLGPPGTGKTHLLAWLILGYVVARRRAGLPARVFVSAFTRSAIGNLLDAVVARADRTDLGGFDSHFVGSGPPAGLSPRVRHRASLAGAGAAAALTDLGAEAVVMGGTVWSLFRLLSQPSSGSSDRFTAGIFDLVCLDEASQMVLAQGLMSMGGLKEGGRLVVAGDDKQLPPVRSSREVELGGRVLGDSLYAFLKSANAPEFALDETFRLNRPLASFPERKFYPGHYRSAVPEQRLELTQGWEAGLEPWEAAVLDPAWPVAVLLHDGPPAATSNPFEAVLAARLSEQLAERLAGARIDGAFATDLWRDRLAIVSPHRAQNILVRSALRSDLRSGCFVETVDRIQGKERDAVILSYCVADAEFALAEADFIFAPERLNVAVTRARTKLIVLVSRRLLDAVPGDQDQMDKAELLREFVFGAGLATEVTLHDPTGGAVQVQVRLAGFTDPPVLEVARPPEPGRFLLEELPPHLQRLVEGVRVAALASEYGTARPREIREAIALAEDPLPGLAELHARGFIRLEQRTGKYGPFWLARPLAQRRHVFAADRESVRRHAEEVIDQCRRGRLSPYYTEVRDRFAWVNTRGQDVLEPVFEQLRREGLLAFGEAKGQRTVDWTDAQAASADAAEPPPPPDLSDEDFRILNTLEDLEARRINFGVFETWVSAAGLAEETGSPRHVVTAALARLAAAGWVMFAEEGRVRSRMAELAREVRYVKQRFKRDDASSRPYLVRSLKLELRDRDKPERRRNPAGQCFAAIASRVQGHHAAALRGLSATLAGLWGEQACMAGFQARSLEALSLAWQVGTSNAFVVAADTGSGKTEAAGFPIIAGAAADRMAGVKGTRAILAYPRIRLATNQAQRLVSYLAALARQPDMPVVTIGLQFTQVPESFDRLQEWDRQAGWQSAGAATFAFPLFACPNCGGELLLNHGRGTDGADRLNCTKCDWTFSGWVGSKAALRENPPALFLPTVDSLHQWMHDKRYGRIFGDDGGFASPRAVLADEIHLYSHVHGAQVGLALRRLAARAELNAGTGAPMLAIGMSATLGDPAGAWGRLIGREEVGLLTPTADEREPNPRGREYFFFVQPEVESRGQDIAGASTTIQSLMCLAHGMRRRTGKQGGFRSLVFLDSIDKVRRLHAAYDDAEMRLKLAAYRTRRYPDDPVTGAPRDACCGQPHGCDTFRDGECWIFAATDPAQRNATGAQRPGRSLQVAAQPVFSGTSGRVEALIKDSDVVFATSSLEVGYDDPDITLVYQHYAPQNLASFVQRKGRGGRGADDRPITGVTLSIYSGRDSWWFRRPREMIEPTDFTAPLNPDNFFVRRGQLLAAALDAFARHERQTGRRVDLRNPSAAAMADADHLTVRVFGPSPWLAFEKDSLGALWAEALQTVPDSDRLQHPSDMRQNADWVPNLLFDAINLPRLTVRPGNRDPKSEDIALIMMSSAPGNATRRFDGTEVHWRPPIAGRGPWLSQSDYTSGSLSRPFGDDPRVWLDQLPDIVHQELGQLSPDYFRPRSLSLETLGRMHGVGWQSDWVAEDAAGSQPRRAVGNELQKRRVGHDSRGSLRGFPIVKADAALGRAVDSTKLSPWVTGVESFTGDGLRGRRTGLTLARVFWGADAELRLADRSGTTATYSQVFTAPGSDHALLHGYHVQTEGIRLTLNNERLDAFVESELESLRGKEAARRWHAGQMLRFLVESQAQAAGVNAYEARRGAELMVSAAGDPDLKQRLTRLLAFWSSAALASLLEDTRARLISQHPLLSSERVGRVAQALAGQRFQAILLAAVRSTADADAFRRYLKSALLHALAVRVKESFLQVGRGDERQVIMHVRLPLQFAGAGAPTITICEAGAFGDGTTRAFLERFDEAARHWRSGFIATCPNAREDAAVQRLFEQPQHHAVWRSLDPNNIDALGSMNRPLGLHYGEPVPATVLRLLFGTETVGDQRFEMYDLATAVRASDARLTARLGRSPSAWELTSVVVAEATGDATSPPGRLLRAYAGIDDAAMDESLSPEGRLADQVFRLHARLCVDGCRACVHQPSDIMSDSLAEASTSRTLLERFLSKV